MHKPICVKNQIRFVLVIHMFSLQELLEIVHSPALTTDVCQPHQTLPGTT